MQIASSDTTLIAIIVLTVLVSARAFQDRSLQYKLMFNAYQVKHRRQFYRLFSHGLVHGDWMHLLVNMFVLFSFGKFLLSAFQYYFSFNSSLLFLVFYVLALPISSLFSLRKEQDNPGYNAVGASGAVSAIVFASIYFDPWNPLYLFGILPIPGILFGAGYLIYSYKMGQRNVDNIGHDAHFWGALFGMTFPVLIQPSSISIFIQNLFTLPF